MPSLGAIQDAVNASSDLRISHMEDFGLHYARTLREWYTNFMVSLSEIKQMGYSDEFIRLWQYYLCYCEAGFLERYTSVVQLVFDKPKHVPGM